MTDTEIIKAIAELDGWKGIHGSTHPVGFEGYNPSTGVLEHLPNYLTSRDAIVPVIEKQRTYNQFFFCDFQKELVKVVQGREPDWNKLDYPTSISAFESIVATPRQLCKALLRSTNKRKD
jgi:hypothetical protein